MKKLVLPLFLLWCSWANASVSLDGSSQYLSSTANLGFNGATQMSWMINFDATYSSSPANGNGYFAFYKVIAGGGASCDFYDNGLATGLGSWECYWSDSSGNIFDVAGYLIPTGPTIVPYGTRHQFIFIWKRSAGDVSDFSFYFDGVFYNSSNVFDDGSSGYSTSFTTTDSSTAFYIGDLPTFNPSYFSGQMGEVAAWNKALTASDVATLWNNGIFRPCQRLASSVESANLLFYAPLDDKQNGTVATTPTQLGSVTVSLAAQNSPTWSRVLECGTASIKNARLNNCKINGGSF